MNEFIDDGNNYSSLLRVNGAGMSKDLKLALNESNLLVKPGEIHMNDDELRNGIMDPSSVTENDEREHKASNRTGMDE